MNQDLKGVVRGAEEGGTQFRTWTTEARASSQKDKGSSASESMAVILSLVSGSGALQHHFAGAFCAQYDIWQFHAQC